MLVVVDAMFCWFQMVVQLGGGEMSCGSCFSLCSSEYWCWFRSRNTGAGFGLGSCGCDALVVPEGAAARGCKCGVDASLMV